MKINPMNTMIAEIFSNIAYSQDDLSFTGNDYDGMTYRIDFLSETKKIQVSFGFETYQEIYDIVGDNFFKTYYGDCELAQNPIEDYNFTFIIDIMSFTKLPKVPKGATPEEKIAVKKERDNIKNERAAFLKEKQDKLSKMRRNFFAAPFE